MKINDTIKFKVIVNLEKEKERNYTVGLFFLLLDSLLLIGEEFN